MKPPSTHFLVKIYHRIVFINPAKLGRLGFITQQAQVYGFCCLGNKPSKPS